MAFIVRVFLVVFICSTLNVSAFAKSGPRYHLSTPSKSAIQSTLCMAKLKIVKTWQKAASAVVIAASSILPLTTMAAVSTTVAGCSSSSGGYHHTPFYTDYVTNDFGIRIQMPYWVDPIDYDRIGDIIDGYFFDYYDYLYSINYISTFPTSSSLRVIITDEIHDYPNSIANNIIDGYDSGDDIIFVSWRKDPFLSTPTPDYEDVFPDFGHQLSHRFGHLHSESPHSFELEDATDYAHYNPLDFNGYVSGFNPSSYYNQTYP